VVSDVTRYDLTPYRELPLSRSRRKLRPVTVILMVLMTLLAITVATSGFSTITGHWSAGKAAFLLLPALVVAVAALAFSVGAPGATSLEVTDEDVVLEFERGRRWSQAWASPDFRLTIESAPALGPRSSQPVPIWVAYGPGLRSSFLSEEAYNDICQVARAHGLRMTSLPGRFRGARTLISR
jgi:hypothetical protein